VEIAPHSNPPVCKIMDYGKFIYETAKKTRESKKKQVSNDLKTIKIRLNIGESDFAVKVSRIIEFLEDGDKVKMMILFKGREIIYKQRGFEMLERIAEVVQEHGRLERKPKLEGRNIIAIIAPISKKG
jgi:translation initiation factor IF-3